MDDSRIKALTDEVLAQVRAGASGPEAGADLESRVAALEAAVRGLHTTHAPRAGVTAAAVVLTSPHPSQALLAVQGGGTGQCLMEPDKPCVGSGACRTFGH